MENVFLLDVIIGFEHGKSGCLSYINSNCGGGLWLSCREGWSSGFRSGPRGERGAGSGLLHLAQQTMSFCVYATNNTRSCYSVIYTVHHTERHDFKIKCQTVFTSSCSQSLFENGLWTNAFSL